MRNICYFIVWKMIMKEEKCFSVSNNQEGNNNSFHIGLPNNFIKKKKEKEWKLTILQRNKFYFNCRYIIKDVS